MFAIILKHFLSTVQVVERSKMQSYATFMTAIGKYGTENGPQHEWSNVVSSSMC